MNWDIEPCTDLLHHATPVLIQPVIIVSFEGTTERPNLAKVL